MLDDLTLISQLKSKNKKALSSLYDKYSGAIYGVIIRVCKNESLAEEVLQETFLKIWEKIDSFDPEKGKFFTWAYRIAKNKALNSIRNQSDLIQNQDLSVYENKSTINKEIDELEVRGSIKKLDLHHQKAIELVYFKGLTHREAHEEMNVPLGTFKSYIQQALRGLREIYKEDEINIMKDDYR